MPAARRSFLMPALLGAVTVGILQAAQVRINGQLGARLDDSLMAAFISFLVGLVLIAVVVFAAPSGRDGLRTLREGLRERRIPFGLLCGGMLGAFYVTTQTLTAAIIGVAAFSAGNVAGQAVSGLLLDRFGHGPAGRVPVTTPRVVGGTLALIAVSVTMSGDALARVPLWMFLLPFAAGVLLAWQQSINGLLSNALGTPLTTTLVSFAAGILVLVVVVGAKVAIGGMPASFPSEPWIYLGGALGGASVVLAAASVPRIGVLVMGLASVTGQLLTSIAIDLFWPAAAPLEPWQQIATVLFALASVVVVAVPWRILRRR